MSTVQRALVSAVLVVLTTLVAVAVGSVGIAMAEPPTVTIESPLPGSSTNNPMPSFSGTTSDIFDQVTLDIYAGEVVGGTPVALVALPPLLEGKWSLTPTSPLAGGTYTAVATQTLVAETGFSEPPVTFTVEAAPVITTNPTGQTVLAGEGATFVAVASGVPTPEVQWQVSTDGGLTFSDDTTDTGNMTGTLTVASASVAESGQEYRAVFTNTAGPQATSAPATLTVDAAPVVTTDPAGQTVLAGEDAVFTAAASGAPTPTVQWQLSTNGGSTWIDDTTDAGNTTGTLTVAGAVVGENGYEYRAIFTNGVGLPATSAPATLTVHAAPVVTANPVGQTILAGEDAVFTAAASGAPAPTVQWQVSKNGGSTFSNDTTDAGNTTDTLTVASAVIGESGYEYRAVFTNGVGSPVTSAPAMLTVEAAPVVTTNPASKGVLVGEGAMFTASASGAPTPTVQWQVSTSFGSTWIDDTTDVGNTTGTLTVASAVVGESGYEYRAVFRNGVGSPVTSAPATLTVDAAPVVTIDPTSKSVVAGEGATFVVAASGAPTPTVQWQVSKNGGSTFSNDTTDAGNTTDTLTVASAAIGENGYEYRAVFTNVVFGTLTRTATSAPATLTVAKKTVAPVVTTNPVSKSVVAGKDAVFTAAASGVPTPTVQWQVSTDFGSTWIDTTDTGNATDTLTVAGALAAESGYEYRAVFTNAAGPPVTTAPASLTVDVAPVIVINPVSESVVAGETATFTAAASGTPTPTLQWQESTNGGAAWIAMPGATADTLTVANTTLAESGQEYRAVFTNTVKTATTLVATLTVSAPAPAPELAPTITPRAPSPPVASFAWFPTAPHTGEPVSLVSSSTDVSSPITSFAWDTAGNGTFQAGKPVISTSFSTPGSHVVRLRVTDANGLSSIVAETVVVIPPPLTLMQPFPIVRIAGSDSSSGVKLSLLTVQAPLGARVTAQCRGRGCPVKSESRLARSSKNKAGTVLVVFRRFERSLRAGVILSIRVSSLGEIGKYTSFTIRRNKPPVRVDACIGPTNPKPIPCPAS
ncbi:MAG TPA: PKD domain-containing protein [Solirubrobacteraceae bacterium]